MRFLDTGQLLDTDRDCLSGYLVLSAGSSVPIPACWAWQQLPVASAVENWVKPLQLLPGRGGAEPLASEAEGAIKLGVRRALH